MCLSLEVIPWSNHTLIVHALVSKLPFVKNAESVKVETLEQFLIENEQALAVFLNRQEKWMVRNLNHYAIRPEELEFKASGNISNIKKRFAHAIRINPLSRMALYLQLLPGEDRPSLKKLLPEDVRSYPNKDFLNRVNIVELQAGQLIKPLDVLVTASDEPDHGLDLGLFKDSNTVFGKSYGFGVQPFGKSNIIYSSQAPFHMGFYHESAVVYQLASYVKQTYPEYRILLYKQLSEFAFAQGHDYWGWRFMGWGLHYIGDFSNPYHVTLMPGSSTLDLLEAGVLKTIGYDQSEKDMTQLVTNRHILIEDFQKISMSAAYRKGLMSHPLIKALTLEGAEQDFHFHDVISLYAKKANTKADQVNKILLDNMPERFANDVNFEYASTPLRPHLLEEMIEQNGPKGVDMMTKTVANLLTDFSTNANSYIRSITNKKDIDSKFEELAEYRRQ